MITGLVIGVIAIAALVSFAQWEEWVNLILGLWVGVSSRVLSFSAAASATGIHVIIGLAAAILATVELRMMSRRCPQRCHALTGRAG